MGKKTMILVADDDENIRSYLKEYLELEGYLVEEVSNGIDAEKYLLHTKPDHLLVDIFMPDKDGFEILSQFKNTGINIIAMSGHAAYLAMTVSLGANSALLKPFGFESLNKLIKT